MSDSDGAEIPSQVNVWWDHRNRISTAKYEVGISYDPNLLFSHGESWFLFLGRQLCHRHLYLEWHPGSRCPCVSLLKSPWLHYDVVRGSPLVELSWIQYWSFASIFLQRLQIRSFNFRFWILQVVFVAKVPALGLNTYFVSSGLGSKLSERATITAFHSQEPHNIG